MIPVSTPRTGGVVRSEYYCPLSEDESESSDSDSSESIDEEGIIF